MNTHGSSHRLHAARIATRRLWLSLALVTAIVLASLLPVAAAPLAAPAAAPAAPQPHKAIAPAGLLDGAAPGVTLWHDYGAFGLYKLSDAALASLPAAVRGQLQIDAQMDTILFDRHPLDTRTGDAQAPALLASKSPAGPALHLVQFVGPIQDNWLEAVQATGADLVQYMANNAYLVWASPASRNQLDALAQDGAFVQYSGAFQPAYKLGPSIEQRILEGTDPNQLVPVVIQIYNHAGKKASQDVIASLTAEVISGWSPILAFENSKVQVRAADLLTIARLPDVVWVGELFPREMNDEVQGQIIAGNLNGSQSGPSGPGYKAWLDALGFSQNPADYPLVSVADDGVGSGATANGAGDVTLTRLGDGVTSRIIFANNCTSSATAGGIGGHGHINTSIVSGYDQRSGFPFLDPNGYLRGQGINPYGRTGNTKIFTDGGSFSLVNCGNTDTGLIKSEQDNGAQISTNSWGCSGCAATYDDSSQAYDVGVRDADLSQAGNQELIYIFSAGNSGSGAGTIGTPGNGKNMLTVGASENQRPSDESGAWTDGCGIGPTGADNAMDIISFSSRGPAPGGRIKPETIAPGTHIQGTASTNAGYNGGSVCDQYRPGSQTVFAASSGTSHSTPAVAGVASLYYRWLQTTYGVATPSPALMKAYVLAHPTYLTGVAANDTLPSNSQGYGMPNMKIAFDTTPRSLLNQTEVFGATGQNWTWNGAVADPGKPVRIVMTYTDAAGAIGTSPQVNNLNLAATIGVNTYLGNRFSGQWSITGGSADNANNYEAVFLPVGTSGPLQITVTGANIAGDGVPNNGDPTDQDFALVCYNCAQNPDFTQVVTPASLDICTPADAVYTVNVGSILGFVNPVTLSAAGNPVGTTATFSPNPVTPPNNSTFTVGSTGAAAPGSYTIAVNGTANGGTPKSVNVGLNLYSAAPAAATLTAPANGALNVPAAPTFTWNAVPQAASYNI
ncbi:MAG: S8 family serine peptidase, partial [Anaerolinea sp.]|nr:S8 family serine peptidase [Anaerolinea sp.]